MKLANVIPVIRDVLDMTGVSDYVTLLNPSDKDSTNVFMPCPILQKRRLGDELVFQNLITEDNLDAALEMQSASGKRLGQILVDQAWIKEIDLLPVLAQLLQVPYVKLNTQLYDSAIIDVIKKEKAIQLSVMPLFKVRDVLFIATPSPLSIPVNDEIEDRTGCKIKAILASRKDLMSTIGEAYSETQNNTGYGFV